MIKEKFLGKNEDQSKKIQNKEPLLEKREEEALSKNIFCSLSAKEKVRKMLEIKAKMNTKALVVVLAGMEDQFESIRRVAKDTFAKFIENGCMAEKHLVEEARNMAMSNNTATKAAGIYALGGIGEEKDLLEIIKAYGMPDQEIKSAAVEAVNLLAKRAEKGLINKEKAFRMVKIFMGDSLMSKNPMCRQCVYLLLKHFGRNNEECIKALEKGMKDPDLKARGVAYAQLKELKEK